MQHVLLDPDSSNIFNHGQTTSSPTICYKNVWDANQARFQPCFLPVVATFPSILAALILFVQALRILIPWRPRWMRPFVEEIVEPTIEIDLVPKRRWTIYTVFLIGLSSIGLVLQLAAALLTPKSILAFMPMLPWLVIVLELLTFRPRTIPFAVLSVAVCDVIAIAAVLSGGTWQTDTTRALSIGTIVVGILVVSTILLMPFRDAYLPSKDISKPFTTPTSTLRSPEDNMKLWQFMTVSWLEPLLSIGYKRQVEDEDVWLLAYEFHHRRLHDNFRALKGSVIRRLLTANAIDLFIVVILGLIEQVAAYATPVFLQLILSTMQRQNVPNRTPMTYAGLTLVARLIACQIGVFTLWFGRRCYERSRGEMMTMLFEKTLGRKVSFKEKEELNPNTETENSNGYANGDITSKQKPGWWQRISGAVSKPPKSSKSPPPSKQPASTGKILNLLRNDAYEVAQRFWEFDSLVRTPLSITFSITLIVAYLGWASMLAVALVILAQIINAGLAKILVYYEKKRRSASDVKLQVVSQFVEAIRHLRWYGWQGSWLSDIMSARQKELALRVICAIWNMTIGFINVLALELTPVAAFFTYTVIAKRQLTVDIAFPALQLFTMMTKELREVPQLIITLINAWVSISRIEDFMAEPDKQEMATEALVGDKLALSDATFNWSGSTITVLSDVDVSFQEGMNLVCGEVGSGKTALLQALLGELDMKKGELIRPQEPIGYCAQSPWLQSMSIRENILFSEVYDEKRYKQVLNACALVQDLSEMKAGDLTMIGENGTGLSGGQRARVALARAVYSYSKILLLDDPLSALDQQTAEAIVQNCFAGPLCQGRTTILVTHRTDLVVGLALQTIKITDGRASILSQDVALRDSLQRATSNTILGANRLEEVDASVVPDKFIEDEHRQYGGVKASVYWEYIKAGKLKWWSVTIVLLALIRLIAIAETWLLKSWGEAYEKTRGVAFLALSDDIVHVKGGLFGNYPPPDVNIKPWLIALLLFALGKAIGFIVAQVLLLVIVYTAGKNMFRAVMIKVANATFRFYDVTPVGRLMNRMTSDMTVIDGGISQQFQLISWHLLIWIFSVVVIASVTPTFLVFTLFLTGLFVVTFLRFIPTSQSLRRLEMVSLTPLISNFGSLANGLITVRAFCVQSRFQDRVIEVVDTFQKMDHFYWSTQAWLMYRYDLLSALSNFMLFVLALATGLTPGMTAFVLTAAERFVVATHSLCKQYGLLQMEFVSVERVVELLHLEQEPEGDVRPPAWWPLPSGDIVFKDVTIKYAPHLDPALEGISFTVKGGSKTAVIGRTGSGKSSLALALLATVLPDMGHIFIDNVDLSTVEKQLLRTRITFLAQDPVLFPGTMRQNLDPVEEHTDEACDQVLRRVCERQGWDLETNVEDGGKNLSQGQRQLVGLARAVLRRSAIIILDEATASIDRETAMQIQQVIHEEMRDSTVITIAHRLEAVRNADYCIVLGKGHIIEQGSAAQMLRDRHENISEHVDEDKDSDEDGVDSTSTD